MNDKFQIGHVGWSPNYNSNKPRLAEVDVSRVVLLLNEAYIFLGMQHAALHPWKSALGEWQAKVEQETGWNHFAEVRKFEQNAELAQENFEIK